MVLSTALRNTLGFVKRAIGYRSLATADLIQRNLPNIVAPLRPQAGRIVIDALGLSLDPNRHGYYLAQMSGVRDLVQAGGHFVLDGEANPEYRIGDLRITPENRDDLFVLSETFGKRLYEIRDGREWFVLDVGMNVGYVSLYFAGIMGWESLAYEPFPTTFARAVGNIERNGLGHLVHARNAGVGGKSERIEIAFDEEARSTNGLFGNLQLDKKSTDVQVEVEIVDVKEALEEALALAKGRPLLLKLDCEGAEYDIIDRLAELGLLDRMEALIVEYHFILPEHTAERIHAPLLESGFLIKTLWNGVEAGGLLALRRNSPVA